MNEFFTTVVPTAPLVVRGAVVQKKITLVEDVPLMDWILTLERRELVSRIPTTVQSMPYGEVDMIFLRPLLKMMNRTPSTPAPKDALALEAENLASLAHTMMVLRSKDAEISQRLLIEQYYDLAARPPTLNKAGQPIPGTEKAAQTAVLSNMGKDMETGDFESRGTTEEIAFLYAGAGLIKRRINVGSTESETTNLTAHLRRSVAPFLDGVQLTGSAKLHQYHGLRMYLEAIAQYDGLFGSKFGMSPTAFYTQKASRIFEYAHMFITLAHIPTLYRATQTIHRLRILRDILLPTALWTPMQDLEWSDVSDKYDRLKSILPTLPVGQAEDVIKRFTTYTGADGFLLPEDLGLSTSDFEAIKRLGKATVQPGEESLYLPLALKRTWDVPVMETTLARFHTLIRTLRNDLSEVYAGVGQVQTVPDVKANFVYAFSYPSQATMLEPRLTTLADEGGVPTGLKRMNPSGLKYLTPYINGVMSYRHLLEQVQADYPTVAVYLERSLNKTFLFPDASIMLPVPDMYLEGEVAFKIGLSDDTLTRLLRTKGFFEMMSFARSVDLLMFRSDPVNFGLYAGLLSGAFTVILGEKRGTDKDAYTKILLKSKDGHDIGAALTGKISAFGSTRREGVMPLNPDISAVSCYGIPADRVIEANVHAHAELTAEQLMAKIIWADPGTRTFGLLPHVLLPMRGILKPAFVRIDAETTALQFFRAEFLTSSGRAPADRLSQETIRGMMTGAFAWTDMVALLPHMMVDFMERPAISQFAAQIAVAGNSLYTYMTDCITTPTLAAVNQNPEPWLAVKTSKTEGATKINLDAILREAETSAKTAASGANSLLIDPPQEVVITGKDEPVKTAPMAPTLEAAIAPPGSAALPIADPEDKKRQDAQKRAGEEQTERIIHKDAVGEVA